MIEASNVRFGVVLIWGLVILGCARSSHPRGRDNGMYDWKRADGLGILHLETTHTEAYCKGVAPRPEDYPTAQPWSGVLYIRKAVDVDAKDRAMNDVKRAPVDSIRTDGSGHGSIALTPGQYILLDADRATDRRYHQLLRDHAEATPHRAAIDKACMDDWLRGPFPAFTITAKDTTRVDHHTQGQCSWNSVPCAMWRGPLPP
jgi:hypothetical protein